MRQIEKKLIVSKYILAECEKANYCHVCDINTIAISDEESGIFISIPCDYVKGDFSIIAVCADCLKLPLIEIVKRGTI